MIVWVSCQSIAEPEANLLLYKLNRRGVSVVIGLLLASVILP